MSGSRACVRRILQVLSSGHVRLTIDGQIYRLPLEGNSLRWLFRSHRRNPLEKSEGEYFRQVLDHSRPGHTIFDIGAHKGLYTLAFSGRVGEEGHVVSFEPNPHTFAILTSVVAINGLNNVSPVEAAVGGKDGVGSMWTAGTAPGSSMQKHGVSGNEPPEAVEVRLCTVDSFVKDTGRIPDLIKIDVEGAEHEVLRGAARTIEAVSPIMCCEIHPERLEAFGSSSCQVTDFLKGFGYRSASATSAGQTRVVYVPGSGLR
jgi:FkbM family methyltransferase